MCNSYISVITDTLEHCWTLSQFGIQIYMILIASFIFAQQSLQLILLPSPFEVSILTCQPALLGKVFFGDKCILEATDKKIGKLVFIPFTSVEISSTLHFKTGLMMVVIVEAWAKLEWLQLSIGKLTFYLHSTTIYC